MIAYALNYLKSKIVRIHEINNRATPNRLMIYKHAIVLHKLYNQRQPLAEWVYLNFQHQFSIRGELFQVTKTNNSKVDESIMTNRLSLLNNLIPLTWLNLGLESFKIKLKEKSLRY
jgi:hypothetical protein